MTTATRLAALATATIGLASAIVSTAPATAAIVCKEGYQIVRGQPISTPYCEDAWLAEVARGYGTRVSAAAIRNNPATKHSVCRLVGHDNRVSQICASVLDRGNGRRF